MCTLDLLYWYFRVTSTTTTTVMTTKIATTAAAATPIVRAGMIEALHNTFECSTCNSNYLLCQVGDQSCMEYYFFLHALLCHISHLITTAEHNQKKNDYQSHGEHKVESITSTSIVLYTFHMICLIHTNVFIPLQFPSNQRKICLQSSPWLLLAEMQSHVPGQ